MGFLSQWLLQGSEAGPECYSRATHMMDVNPARINRWDMYRCDGKQITAKMDGC